MVMSRMCMKPGVWGGGSRATVFLKNTLLLKQTAHYMYIITTQHTG